MTFVDKSLTGVLRQMRKDIDSLWRRVSRTTPIGGTIALRDLTFPPPTTVAEQVDLANQQITWWNTELGWQESYYAPAGSAGLTARGLVAGVSAGWFPTEAGALHGKLQAIGSEAHGNGQYFTNWANFGTATGSGADQGESWRSHTLISRPLPDTATLQTVLPGRYDLKSRMAAPGGTGTAVWRFGYLDGGSASLATDQGLPLLNGYGQMMMAEFNDVLLYATGRCYWQTVSASWSPGNAGSWMSMRYIGPPLVNAT